MIRSGENLISFTLPTFILRNLTAVFPASRPAAFSNVTSTTTSSVVIFLNTNQPPINAAMIGITQTAEIPLPFGFNCASGIFSSE